jgi:hypothetical protein
MGYYKRPGCKPAWKWQTNFNKNFDRRYEQMLKPRTVHEVYTKAIFCCLQILDSIKPVNLNRPLVITHKSLSVNEKELEFHPLSNYFLRYATARAILGHEAQRQFFHS